MTVFLGTLWSTIKQIKAPYVFHWEHGIALHALQGIGPHLTARENSHGFSRVSVGTWVLFSSYGIDEPSKLVFVQRTQYSCLVMRDTSEISMRLGRAIRTLLEVRLETKGPFLVASVILGFLSIFNKSHAKSPFEALNSTCLLMCQRDVSSPVQMRRGPRAFSIVSTGVSVIASCCEMKEELHSSHCREIRPSFEPGHLVVHST